ncbi:MAG: tripartite tricarboxylate transporter permease, partial [Gammaproteobacteria bacterium]
SLLFTAWELFLLVLLGVLVAGSLSSKDPLKGWMAGFIGLLFAQVGLDDIHMHARFSFDSTYLQAGIGLIAAIVGLFGISEVMMSMRDRQSRLMAVASKVTRILPTWSELKGRARLVLQSGLIGTFVGILPGLGADMGAWVSYDAAKRTSKNPQMFGKGSMEGVIAAETGNNAVVPGALIPVIALGLPGSAGAAIIMAGLFLHGMKPGPTFMIDNVGLFEYMVAALVVGSFMLLVVGLIMAHGIVHVLRVPRANIMAVVIALAAMGAYASKLQFNDLWMMIAFGVLAYVMRRFGFPLPPLVLGIVLGRLLDEYMRQALMISDGSLTPLFARPICLVLMIILVAFTVLGIPAVRAMLRRRLLPTLNESAGER